MAGGYAGKVEDTVDIHFQSVKSAATLREEGVTTHASPALRRAAPG
jgi:hypothetical protein